MGQRTETVNSYHEREMKMTWSILIVFLCYIFCAAPITILVLLNEKASYYWIIATGLYLTLFVLNFFVYSFQNEQYQKAFTDYLKMWKYLLSNGSLNEYRSTYYQESIILSRMNLISFHTELYFNVYCSCVPVRAERGRGWPGHRHIQTAQLWPGRQTVPQERSQAY